MSILQVILSVFVLPTGLAIVLVAAGLVWRRRLLCWAGIAMLWIASTPLLGNAIVRAAEDWQVRQSAASMPVCDAIVVLSEGRLQPPGVEGVSEWTDADRFFGGVALYKAGKAPLLVFTGGWSPRLPTDKLEGDHLVVHAQELGIPLEKMRTTARVQNTAAEAHAVSGILAAQSVARTRPKVLLVTSAYHMRRARLLFTGAGMEVTPFPVDFKVHAGEEFSLGLVLPSSRGLLHTETALREFYGYIYYWMAQRMYCGAGKPCG